MKYNKYSHFLFLNIIATSFIACGGSSNTTEDNLITGQFVDSPVGNINYKCGEFISKTDNNGYWKCYKNDEVTFYIGNLILGSSQVKETITPLDLNISYEAQKNVAQILQTLDYDNNSENGIFITDTDKEIFNQFTINIENDNFDTTVSQYINKNLISETIAMNHLLQNTSDETISLENKKISFQGTTTFDFCTDYTYIENGIDENNNTEYTIYGYWNYLTISNNIYLYNSSEYIELYIPNLNINTEIDYSVNNVTNSIIINEVNTSTLCNNDNSSSSISSSNSNSSNSQCSNEYNPVCYNNITYNNPCEANLVNIYNYTFGICNSSDSSSSISSDNSSNSSSSSISSNYSSNSSSSNTSSTSSSTSSSSYPNPPDVPNF